MSVYVPRSEESPAVPVGGPRNYPVKTCAERGFHIARFSMPENGEPRMRCTQCELVGNAAWGKQQLAKEGDFYLELGSAIEDLARTQIREHRTIFDSDNEGLCQAASRAGGKQ